MAKILSLVSFKVFPPHMGGQKGVVLFYEALQQHHSVFMAASSDNKGLADASFPVKASLFPNRKMQHNIFRLSALTQFVRQQGIDVIVAEHSYTGWLAWLLHLRTGKPFIIHSHNIETVRFRQMEGRAWKLYQPYEGWIHRRAHHNFFISAEDRQHAIHRFKIKPDSATVLPYGFQAVVPKPQARTAIRARYGITTPFVFHFNGTMDYEPNMEAVSWIATKLQPALQASGIEATILVSGKRLPPALQQRVKESRNVLYLDFVPDIDEMYQGADLFINPVQNNSGVKTKLIECLANHCTAVSFAAGAAGIEPEAYRNKIFLSPNGEVDGFVKAVQTALQKPRPTPPHFFETYSWTNIAASAAKIISQLVHEPIAS